MKTDLPLKTLFLHHAADLLSLTGDEQAAVESVAPVEIPAHAVRVDTVLRLRRGGESYFRHLEFQARWRRGIERRFFEYNTQLVLRLGRPVVTTIFWLLPPGPRDEPVFRVIVNGREVNAWRFESVRLWEIDAQRALGGPPGLAALVPLLRGGGERDMVARAARHITATAPVEERAGLVGILSALLGRRYTFEEILDLVGGPAMIESNFLDEFVRRGRQQGLEQGLQRGLQQGREQGLERGLEQGLEQGLQQGLAKGRAERLDADRRLCLDMLREYHPRLVTKLAPRVRACTDGERLRGWILRAPRLDDEAFTRLVLRRGH